MAVEMASSAIPEWTELNQKRGLDPLGMQTSGVSLYASLLPGISNVTLRVRYYGLYTWLSQNYARRIGDTNPKKWQQFLRRSEALYALIGQFHGNETGVAGSDWASRILGNPEISQIDIAADADPGRPTHYLKQAWGAYGAAYKGQLFETGLFADVEEHEIPVPGPTFGDDVAKAFSDAVTEAGEMFLEIVERGTVSRDELSELVNFAPSEIAKDSPERDWYERILFADAGLERESDINRRLSLLLILKVAEFLGRAPRPDEVRWYLYSGYSPTGDPIELHDDRLREHREKWWTYQANDLVHICLETILKFVLDLLEPHPLGLTLSRLIGQAVSEVKAVAPYWPTSWADFALKNFPEENATNSDADNADQIICGRVLKAADPRGICSPVGVWDALKLLAILINRVEIADEGVISAIGNLRPEPFRSLKTEVEFVEQNKSVEFEKFLGTLIEQRVIKRHLWVAIKKLRYQRDYTFLFEPDDGRVRLKRKDGPVLTNPRLGSAIAFLKDIHHLGDDGLTSLGRRVLDAS